MRWLLLRTQAIGDAGETDTVIKLEIQELKSRIKEIYHQKFIWNNTKFGIDGLFIYFDNKFKKNGNFINFYRSTRSTWFT
jgi:hypothetical protein